MPHFLQLWEILIFVRVLTSRLLQGSILHNISLFWTKAYTIWSLQMCKMGTLKCVYGPLQEPPHLPVSCSYDWDKGQGSLKQHTVQKKITGDTMPSWNYSGNISEIPLFDWQYGQEQQCGNFTLSPQKPSTAWALQVFMGGSRWGLFFHVNLLQYENTKTKDK